MRTPPLPKPGEPWIQTFTGIAFPLLRPTVDHIDPDDIAHALARQCRFGGHCITFYSVAQHSLLIANWLAKEGFDRRAQLHGLLHDAAEAYVVDIPKPLKPLIPQHAVIEDQVLKVIQEAFGLPPMGHAGLPECVKRADAAILHDERKRLMPPKPWSMEWSLSGCGLGVTIETMMPATAEDAFKAKLLELAP